MGLFHCPVGAAYYDDDVCIDCGLCNAVTSEDKVEASRKIREFIRSQAVKSRRVSKIAVCGKGGAGKSTVTALLAQAFTEAGYKVIVLDSDDSNTCLARMLGFNSYPRPLGEFFSGQETAAPADGLNVEGLPPEFVKNRDSISFMQTGKIYDPFQGCSCSLAESARRIVEKLVVGEKEVLLLDTEAGVESFGRGVERNVDTVIAVVEPSYGSIELAGRIADMAQGMGISRVGVVLNRMVTEEMSATVAARLELRGLNVLGSLDSSEIIARASLEGRPLKIGEDTKTGQVINNIIARLAAV